MNEKDRLNALEVALNNERTEREFYLRNAKRTKNSLGKAMFEQIADEELEHQQRLQELHERWERNEKWPETFPLRVKDTLVKNILKDSVQKTDETPERDDDLKAIKTAIDFEAKGASHYARLRDDVSDPKEKQFFDLLAKIKHEHYLSLEDTEEYLTDRASWYVKREHHGLDGAS